MDETPGDVLAWLNREQKQPVRWIRNTDGILYFVLTGAELQRLRNVLTTVTKKAEG